MKKETFYAVILHKIQSSPIIPYTILERIESLSQTHIL